MNRFVSHILRFMVITAGFIGAIITAALFILFLIWSGAAHGFDQQDQLMNLAFALALPLLVGAIGYYSVLPSVALAVVGEITSRRSWLFYALGGIAVALIAMAAGTARIPDSGEAALILAAGAVGGTVYWLIAGRTAGKHLDELSTSASKGS